MIFWHATLVPEYMEFSLALFYLLEFFLFLSKFNYLFKQQADSNVKSRPDDLFRLAIS